jgi:SPP1 family predicted phage head-tail adaptor
MATKCLRWFPVTIQQRNRVDDGYGGSTVTFTNLYRTRAQVEPLSASEQWRAQRNEMKASHRFRMRYRSGLSSDMRLVFRDRNFNIKSIINEGERDRWLTIVAEENVAEAA